MMSPAFVRRREPARSRHGAALPFGLRLPAFAAAIALAPSLNEALAQMFDIPAGANLADPTQVSPPTVETTWVLESPGATLFAPPFTTSPFAPDEPAGSPGLTIQGTITLNNGPPNGPSTSPTLFGFFIVPSGAALKLSGVTLTGGQTNTSGGAIENAGTVTITDSSFNVNTATSIGGAIFNFGTATIANSIFTDNTADIEGGAIFEFGTATIANSKFTGNIAGLGGAISNNGTTTITNSSFTGNDATASGGAIDNAGTATITGGSFTMNETPSGNGGAIFNSGTLEITGSPTVTFMSNRANFGGAIDNEGTATITGSSFRVNTATSIGGAISNFSTATITNGIFTDNTADIEGGAIFDFGAATIANSKFTGNIAGLNGGAISNTGTGTITNTSFTTNTATNGDGGAIDNIGGTASITNSSFTSNVATSGSHGGGAIYNHGIVTITNSTFNNNTASLGGAILNDLGSTATITNSNFTGNAATSGSDGGGAIYNRVGTINLNVDAGQTSTFSGNTAAGQPSSIFFAPPPPGIVGSPGGSSVLNVDVAAGGLLDMRDPMSGTEATTITGTGQGVWALGGANSLTNSTFSENSGTLYLYAAGEVPNPNPSNSTVQVAPGTIALGGGGSSVTLGIGATLVAAGANSITVTGGTITLADGALVRGGTAADGNLVHAPLSGPITSSLALSATAGVGVAGQLSVQAVAPGDRFTLNANLANASPSTPGSLLVNGDGAAGTVILTGTNTYTGPTRIAGGAVVLIGSLMSPVSVGVGGVLGGPGTILNTLTNAGTVEPGLGLPAGQFGTLTVNNYVGAGGTLALRTFLGADGSPSDQLIINGGTADPSSVRITNAGGPGAMTTGNGIPIVLANNGATTAPNAFTLANGEVRAGRFDYGLFQGGLNGSDPSDWFLRSIFGPELATDGVVQPIARQMGFTMLGTLHERIGDTLRFDNAGTDGAGWGRSGWARFFGQQIDNQYKSLAEPSTTGRLFGVQAGFDIWRGSFIPGHRDAAGIYFAYGNSAVDVDGLITNQAGTGIVRGRTGTVNLYGYSGGAYWTHYGPSGWYLDAVVQGTDYTGNAGTQFTNLQTNGSGIITSLEAGYPIPIPLQLVHRLILEPQGQILWQHTSFRTANDGLGPVGLGSTSGATGRLGLRAQSTIKTASGQVWQPYARANLWQSWGGQATTTFGTGGVPLQQQSTQLEFAAGVTARVNDLLSFYTQAGYEFAVGGATDGGRRQGVKGDIGVRLTFGAPPPPPAAPVAVAAPAPAAARSYLVFFDWDEATLTDRARQIIREAAANSTQVEYTRIEVNGHTDTSGTPRYNQGLSVRRANAVAAELVRNGVPRNVITIRGFGQTHLLVATGPGVREPQNRRVEIIIR